MKPNTKAGIEIFFCVSAPLLLVIADIWVGSYFYTNYAKGTWMEFPTIATCLIIVVLALILFVALLAVFGPEENK